MLAPPGNAIVSVMNREGSAVSRRFAANPPFWGSKVASVTGPAWQKNAARTYLLMVVGIFAFSAVLGGVYLGLQGYAARESGGSRAVAEITDVVVRYGFLAVLFAGVGGWYWWSQRSGRRQILLDVTSDSLTVSKRPGDVYPLRDAKLGVWGISGGMTMGTTLHMHCGPRRFVLGGRDYRVAAGTRLEAPDAGYGLPIDVDAWVGAEDFGQILSIAGRRGDQLGWGSHPPAPAGPTRCLLFPSPLLAQQMGTWAFRRRQQLLQSVNQPRLAVDVGPDEIRVVDPHSHALVASAPIAQVTATPETYRYRYGAVLFGSPDQLASRIFGQSTAAALSTTPVLVVGVPGMQPLSIGCRDTVGGLDRRFSWPGDVRQRVNEPPDFAVSGADWLTLVEKLGLARYLQRHDR